MQANITINSSFEDIKREFPDLYLKSKVEELKTNFNKYDVNNDGILDFEEVKGMLEKLGQPKTHLELKQIIAEVDSSGNGVISFYDFLRTFYPKKEPGKKVETPLPLFGRIYNSSLAKTAESFEKKMRDVTGPTKEDLEAQVKSESALRKQERIEERVRQKAIKEEKEKERIVAEEKEKSRKNFTDKLAAFKQT